MGLGRVVRRPVLRVGALNGLSNCDCLGNRRAAISVALAGDCIFDGEDMLALAPMALVVWARAIRCGAVEADRVPLWPGLRRNGPCASLSDDVGGSRYLKAALLPVVRNGKHGVTRYVPSRYIPIR